MKTEEEYYAELEKRETAEDRAIDEDCKQYHAENDNIIDRREQVRKINKQIFLILKREGDRWRNVENGHVNYGLENALQEIFEETNHRLFRIEDNEVYLIDEEK